MTPEAVKTAEETAVQAGRVLIPASEVAKRVEELGTQIKRDYAGETVQMVVILSGGWIFAADLARVIQPEVDVRVNFIRASSYGAGTRSSGRVRIKGGIQFDITNAKVIVVDDIVDTGRTAKAMIDRLKLHNPESIRLAAMLSKEARRFTSVRIDYLGFRIPNKYVVGYGMDFDDGFRHLPDVRVVEGAPDEADSELL